MNDANTQYTHARAHTQGCYCFSYQKLYPYTCDRTDAKSTTI